MYGSQPVFRLDSKRPTPEPRRTAHSQHQPERCPPHHPEPPIPAEKAKRQNDPDPESDAHSPWSAQPTLPGSRTPDRPDQPPPRSEEHTSELQSRRDLVCRLLLE